MELLTSASLLAAFFAGMAALFAPCCITVLLPVYFASIFRQKKTVFLMTFIFFLGLLVVFLPLGLGAGFLGGLFNKYHNLIYTLGGLLLLFLGFSILIGWHASLPFHVSPKIEKTHPASIFVLGIFSGIATSCCAPVLAGVLTLSVLPGSIFWGGMFALSYVLGMVIPLFVIAYLLDRLNVTEALWRVRAPFRYSLGGKKIALPWAQVIASGVMILMGILIITLTLTGRLAMRMTYQLTVNASLTKFLNFLGGVLGQVPEIVWVGIVLFILFSIIREITKELKNRRTKEQK